MKQGFIGIVIVISLLSCDPIDKRLVLVNDVDEIIFYSFSPKDSIRGRSPFVNSYRIVHGDTIWDESADLLLRDSSKSVAMIGRNAWETYINERCKDSTLRIYIFEKSLITRVPWDTLVSKQQYTERLTYKVKDLEKVGWRVEYRR